MVGGLTRKVWLQIAAVVAAIAAMVIVVVVVAGGDNATDGVATGEPTDEPGTESSPSTSGDTATPTIGVVPTARPCPAAAPTPAPLPTSECDEPVVADVVLGQRDLDADGVDELFVRTGAGAYADIIGVFRVEDCAAVPVTMDGSPAEFAVGASVLNISGLQATSEALVVYSGTSTDGGAFDVDWRTLRLDSGALTEIGSDGGTAQRGDDLHRLASTFGP